MSTALGQINSTTLINTAADDAVYYKGVTAATYAAAIALATGTQYLSIRVTADETNGGYTNTYLYEGVAGVLMQDIPNFASPALPTITFAPAGVPNGTAAYDETTGNIGANPSVGFSCAISANGMTYTIARPNPNNTWFAVGMVGTSVVIVNVSTGAVRTVIVGGTLGTSYNLLPGAALNTSAVRIKYEWIAGDLTVSYRLTDTAGAYTTWGTVTAAQFTANTGTITNQRMGVLGGIGGTYPQIVEFKDLFSVIRSPVPETASPIASSNYYRNYPFYGKSAMVIGDSIVAENFAPASYVAGVYAGAMKDNLKLRWINKNGYSGYTFGGTSVSLGQASLLTYYNLLAPDLFIIWAGTNDYGLNVVIGDVNNITGAAATTTIGGLMAIIASMKTALPASRIIICTPSQRNDIVQTNANTQGATFADYVFAIKQVANYHAVPVCDIFNDSELDASVAAVMSYLTLDGLHPNTAGYGRVVEIQSRFINASLASIGTPKQGPITYRTSAQFDKTSDTALANITGLSVNIVAKKTYEFTVELYTTSNVAGGVKVAIGGTATATTIIYEGLTTNAGLTTQSRGAALGDTVGAVTAVTAAKITIKGTIICNVGGTLTVQFAQNASNIVASSVLIGSTFLLNQIV